MTTKTPMTPEYEAAIARLARAPGVCAREGCGADLLCFGAPPADFTLPEAEFVASVFASTRFGCPHHDIYVIEFVDMGAVNAVLRDPADPVWGWAPPAWRPAVAAAGFGFRAGPSAANPRLRFGADEGRVFITDGRNILALPDGADLAEIEHVHAPRWYGRDTDTSQEKFRIPVSVIRDHIALGSRHHHLGAAPSQLGYPEPWDDHHVAFGETVVPGYMVTLVEACYPGVAWCAAGRMEHIIGLDGERAVAVLGPVDVIAVERRRGASGIDVFPFVTTPAAAPAEA